MRYFIAIVFCFCFHLSGAQPEQILHKTYSERFSYLDSMWMAMYDQGPERVLVQMADLEKWAESKGDKELAREFFFIGLRRRTVAYGLPANDGCDMELAQFALESREKKQFYLEARALQALGEFFAQRKKYGQSFEHLLSAYNIYSKFSAKEFPLKRECLYGFGGAYYQYGDNENSIRYMKEGLAAEARNEGMIRPIRNTIGMCYRKLEKYDSSEYYFRLIYDDALRRHDSTWIGISSGNIGINYFRQKRYDEAIPLIERDIQLSLATNSIKNAAGSMNILAQIYYIRRDYDKAEQLERRALSLVENKGFWPEYSLAEQMFTQLSRIYAAKNDMRDAYLYADSALTAKDSLAAQTNVISYAKAKEKVDFVQHKLEAEQLTSQKQLQIVIRNGLIGFILLLTVIAILFINRQRLKQKKLEVEKRNAEAELGAAATQLDSFRKSVQEKNSLIEQFTGELERIKQATGAPPDEDTLAQLEKAIILTDEQWDHFRELFEKVHKGFFSNLKKKMPDLTPAEVRFLALTKLKLSPKEMASMLGISSNAIRIYRHRLRKKLGLDKDDMIEELVNNV